MVSGFVRPEAHALAGMAYLLIFIHSTHAHGPIHPVSILSSPQCGDMVHQLHYLHALPVSLPLSLRCQFSVPMPVHSVAHPQHKFRLWTDDILPQWPSGEQWPARHTAHMGVSTTQPVQPHNDKEAIPPYRQGHRPENKEIGAAARRSSTDSRHPWL